MTNAPPRRAAIRPSGQQKRSVSLAGHATSIALEPEFWAVLEEMARARGASLARLIQEIDAGRGRRPLASACRLAALAAAASVAGRDAPG